MISLRAVRTRRLRLGFSRPRAGSTALIAVMCAVGLGALVGGPVAAECDGPALSFQEYAATAPTVVIGDVAAIDPGAIVPDDDDPGRSTAFTLTVRYVLRGSPDETLNVSNLPSGPCSGPVAVRVGERVAIAFGVTSIFWDPSNAVAWIGGTPPRLVGLEQLTIAQVFAALGLAPPPTSTVDRPSRSAPIGLLLVVGLMALAIVAARVIVVARPMSRPRLMVKLAAPESARRGHVD